MFRKVFPTILLLVILLGTLAPRTTVSANGVTALFLQGTYVELGINAKGYFGADGVPRVNPGSILASRY